MLLKVENLSCGYGKTPVLRDISFSLSDSDILCILGPNGVGKTTLFKTILGFLPPGSGQVTLDGIPLNRMPRRKMARLVAYVPQAHEPPFPYKVEDVVVMGRISRISLFSAPSREDRAAADAAMESLGISGLKHRVYTEISGGERQLTLIARALAQEPRVLIMDEPTSNLDFGNQVRVLAQIRKLAGQGLGIVMTTHSPDQVFLCGTRVALLGRQGKIFLGDVGETLTEERLREIYGVEVRLLDAAGAGGGMLRSCVPLLDSRPSDL